MLAQNSSGRGDKKCSNSGCIRKVEMTEFAGGLHIEIKIENK